MYNVEVMKGMMRSVVMSVLLVAAGLVMLLGTDSLPKAQAQVTKQYQSNWQATELYRAKFTKQNGLVFYGPQIGVARWDVGGTINGGEVSYTEIWQGPDQNDINFSGNNIANQCAVNPNYHRDWWLVGCFTTGPNGSISLNTTLERVDVNVISDHTCGGNRVTGNAAACKSQFGYSYTDGAYSFNFAYPNAASNTFDSESSFVFHYTAMPLQWKVTGTITYR